MTTRSMKKKGEVRQDLSYMLFDSPIGRCALGWSPDGINSLKLPEADEDDLAGHFKEGYCRAAPGNEPAWVTEAIHQVCTLLSSGKADFSGLPLDMSGAPCFARKVYQRARRMPPGAVMSYGELAAECGSRKAARAVGNAMAHNPVPLIIPCHRVLAAQGKPGGFSSHGGVDTKRRLLLIEGYSLK
jgi:methylated-DNA-[protein]-cysteine S-methyltransferase